MCTVQLSSFYFKYVLIIKKNRETESTLFFVDSASLNSMRYVITELIREHWCKKMVPIDAHNVKLKFVIPSISFLLRAFSHLKLNRISPSILFYFSIFEILEMPR